MKICVCGWYYQKEFYEELSKTDYKITIVSNKKEVPEDINKKYNTIVRENIGLEFGAYNHFIMNTTIDDSVLFLHDDNFITEDNIEPIEVMCEELDQAYIFRDFTEQKNNGGKHGRILYMSSKFINYLKEEHKGIPYDEMNNGYNGTTKNPNNLDYNKGINDYHKLLGRIRDKKLGFNILQRIHVPNIKLGKRGKL